jgi:hypothetical protein
LNQRCAQCGLQLADGGVATLSFGEIVGHVIGACVQTEGFDLVRQRGKLDAEAVPLPTLTIPRLR